MKQTEILLKFYPYRVLVMYLLKCLSILLKVHHFLNFFILKALQRTLESKLVIWNTNFWDIWIRDFIVCAIFLFSGRIFKYWINFLQQTYLISFVRVPIYHRAVVYFRHHLHTIYLINEEQINLLKCQAFFSVKNLGILHMFVFTTSAIVRNTLYWLID